MSKTSIKKMSCHIQLNNMVQSDSKRVKERKKPKNHATKSRGLLKPPFLFMYCLYFLFKTTWTSPISLLSTFLPFVVLKSPKPMILIISCSSGDLPSKSAWVMAGLSGSAGALWGLLDAEGRSRDEERDLLLRLRSADRLLLSLDRERSLSRLLCLLLSRSLSLSLSRSLLDSSLLLAGLGDRPIFQVGMAEIQVKSTILFLRMVYVW